ncbi:MAG TPA: ATP-dependent DNA helicase RecG, partial [Candidatus Cloacimonadota bacterium]|nr:ATP-dependent DNA helicase RecG [Candidatus Cloacimonadota bacterium]
MNKDWNPINSEIKYLKGVGDNRARILNKLDIYTISDLMEYFPRDYINRTAVVKISSLRYDEHFSFVGTIASVEKRMLPSHKAQLNVAVTDGTDYLFLTWFSFGKWFLKQFEIGKPIWVSGIVTEFKGNPQIIHPEFDVLESDETQGFWQSRNVLPVYKLTEGISMNTLRNLIYKAFELYSEKIVETLPAYLLEKYEFEPRRISLQKMHFTQHPQEIPQIRVRYAFEELFFTQLMLARSKFYHHRKEAGHSFVLKKSFTSKLKDSLPFELTSAQKRVIREIVEDMNSPHQMNRLLQGDVGSGKTIVTVFAMLLALENGFQAVLMAPTEILAEQHYHSISKLLENQPEIRIALLKGGVSKEKNTIKEMIKNGEIDIIVGTHALIQKDVEFHNAGFVAIDEQHRFGVEQRAELSRKNHHPDLLYLSATPIPRSLALTVYGDLDVSVIDEMPPHRKPIKTIWYNSQKSALVYEQVTEQLKLGRQIYVVCPLIEESEKIDLLDAETLYKTLSEKVFPQYRNALLHGRMKTAEKDAVMAEFKNGKIDILVSTTVIEVGIDVPNATVMIIQHAERFGLSQLHQLRGRVGRGAQESFCYLIVFPPISTDGRERLQTMVATNDG